jgi:cytochrome c551/c552
MRIESWGGIMFQNLRVDVLATAKNCMSCHAVDKKLVGPAFKDITAKYATDKAATAKLVVKVIGA